MIFDPRVDLLDQTLGFGIVKIDRAVSVDKTPSFVTRSVTNYLCLVAAITQFWLHSRAKTICLANNVISASLPTSAFRNK